MPNTLYEQLVKLWPIGSINESSCEIYITNQLTNLEAIGEMKVTVHNNRHIIYYSEIFVF